MRFKLECNFYEENNGFKMFEKQVSKCFRSLKDILRITMIYVVKLEDSVKFVYIEFLSMRKYLKI